MPRQDRQPQQLSRRDRRMQKRQQHRPRPDSSWIRDHWQVPASVVAATAGAAALGYAIFHKETPTQLPPPIIPPIVRLGPDQTSTAIARLTPQPAETVVTSRQVIDAALKDTRIDDEEKYRWETFGLGPINQELAENELFDAADMRINTALTLMYQSNNEYFKHAADYFADLRGKNQVNFRFFPNDIPNDDNTSLSVNTTIQDNQFHWIINVNTPQVVRFMNTPILATKLTHEITHIENINNFVGSLRGTTLVERLNTESARHRTPSECLREESSGFAAETRSYLRQRGLMGRFDVSDTNLQERYAAFLIKSNYNTQDPLWQTLVRDQAAYCLN